MANKQFAYFLQLIHSKREFRRESFGDATHNSFVDLQESGSLTWALGRGI